MPPAPAAAAPSQATGLRGSLPPAEPTQSLVNTVKDGAASGGGWVSDLLRRASEDDIVDDRPAPPTGNASEAFSNMSAEIAEALDHATAEQVWQRYRRGDRDVFTREIYTANGRRTFDEIRSKYRADKSFREAVDRYIVDFEKLLEDVAENDRDSLLTQTYLTSDTGKVYTMLAHAADRFRAA